jgi:hypothetical protein
MISILVSLVSAKAWATMIGAIVAPPGCDIEWRILFGPLVPERVHIALTLSFEFFMLILLGSRSSRFHYCFVGAD